MAARPMCRDAGLDWPGLAQALTDQLVSLVREVRSNHPDDSLYGASVHEFDVDGDQIGWPNIGVASERTLADAVRQSRMRAADLRWDGPDFHWQRYPGMEQEKWERMLLAQVASIGLDRALSRFNEAVVAACNRARDELVAEGAVDERFLIVPLDDDGELTRRALTGFELLANFPHLVAE